MNKLAQEQIKRQQESIPVLKREIEKNFYEYVKRCASCQRPGEWTKHCGRCKDTYYCSRECQKWAWPVHKQHCYAPGADRPPRPPRRPKPKPAPVPSAEQVDLTDKALRVFYLEGCGDVTASMEGARRALPEAFDRAFVTGATGATVALEAPDKSPLEREDVLKHHVSQVFAEMKEKNPQCTLPPKGCVPLTNKQPTLPAVKLDEAIPVAFAGFSGLGEAFVTAIASDKTLMKQLGGTGAVSRLAGYDEDNRPKPCQGMDHACLIFFAGLHDELPQLPKLFAHVHGQCRNNVVAAAIARKALFYRVEAADEYASPVATKEVIVNSRGVAIDCGRAFAEETLAGLAALDERQLEARYSADALASAPSPRSKLLESSQDTPHRLRLRAQTASPDQRLRIVCTSVLA
jgi:hypothetical protein